MGDRPKKRLSVLKKNWGHVVATAKWDTASPNSATELVPTGFKADNEAEDFPVTPPVPISKISRLSFIAIFKLVYILAGREAVRRKGHFALAFSMIFLIIFILSLIMTLISYSPLVMMSIGEMSEGEIDLLLTPSEANDGGALNYTYIRTLFPKTFHAPRPNAFDVTIYAASTCARFNLQDPFDPSYPYTYSTSCQRSSHCLAQQCSKASITASCYLFDSSLENAATIGRTWPVTNLSQNQAVIDQGLAFALGVSKNDYVFVVVPIQTPFSYQFSKALDSLTSSDPNFDLPSYASNYVVVPVMIAEIVPSPYGKFAITEQIFVVMEYATILNVLAKHMHVDVPTTFRTALAQSSVSLYDQVDSVLFSHSVPRFQPYLTRDFPDLARTLLDWGNVLQATIGPTDTQSTLPVLSALKNFNQMSSFIDMIMQLVILFLAALSIFLIYSLLMVSIETKLFYFGILRMVGMSRQVLIALLMVQALFYSIPACLLGLAVSQLSFIFLKRFLENYLRFTFPPFLTMSAVLFSIGFAVIIPLLSSIVAIRWALTQNLHDALSRNHPPSKGTVVTIERSKHHASVFNFYSLTGLILTVFGFTIYYFMPLSLVNNDLVLLFNIFLFIFVFLIVGLVVLADNFTRLVQLCISTVLFALLFLENKVMCSLVHSNLLIHRVRNRKTSLLYSLALAFIIFITAMTKIQIDTLQYNYRRIVGADVIVYSNSYYTDGTPAALAQVGSLTTFLSNHAWVVDYAWQTWSLDRVAPSFKRTTLSNVGQLLSMSPTVYGVSANFFGMMDPIHLSPSTSLSPTEMLYKDPLKLTAIIGAYYASSFALSPGDRLLLMTQVQDTTYKEFLYPIFFAASAPVFTLTDRPVPVQDVLVSMPTFLNLTEGYFATVDALPLRACYIKLVPGLSNAQFNTFLSYLQRFLTYERVRDIRSSLSVTENGKNVMNLLFQISSAMIMLFTFFSLNTSMLVNILEQAKEIGIMRSLGLTKFATFRMYFYEALILVLSSIFLGCCVGAVFAVTLSLQQSSLTQVPLDPNFNWILIGIVLGLSVVSAFFSTLAPVRALVFKRPLTSILRD